MENKFTTGQLLSFNVYGNEIKGKYICMLDERTVKIEVTYDDSEVTDIGCTANVNLSFLVKDSNYTKTLKNTQGNIEVSYNTTAHLPYAYVLSNTQESDEEAEANSKLISEAFNVTNETGKTPSQLHKENTALRESLKIAASKLQILKERFSKELTSFQYASLSEEIKFIQKQTN